MLLNATGVPENPAGAGRYIYELARVAAAKPDLSLLLCTRRNDIRRWLGILQDAKHNRIIPVAPSSRPARMFYEEFLLQRLAGSIFADNPRLSRNLVLHGPHYVIPPFRSIAKVATIHDLTLVEHREWHEPSKVLYFTHAIKQAVAHAQALVCPSEYTAGKLSDIFNPKCPIVVARHGIDLGLFCPSSPDIAVEDKELLESPGISRRYILHVGTLEPRKNIPLLIKAFDVIAERDKEISLLLAGGNGWRMGGIDKAIGAAKNAQRIKKLGYVSDRQVAALLRRAAAVCYPSAEEGFGLPAAEAMACGAPLVTTEDSAMAEMVGKAALLVPVGSFDLLVEALQVALAGGRETESRRLLGIEMSYNFTWEKSLKNHLKAYELALGG